MIAHVLICGCLSWSRKDNELVTSQGITHALLTLIHGMSLGDERDMRSRRCQEVDLGMKPSRLCLRSSRPTSDVQKVHQQQVGLASLQSPEVAMTTLESCYLLWMLCLCPCQGQTGLSLLVECLAVVIWIFHDCAWHQGRFLVRRLGISPLWG